MKLVAVAVAIAGLLLTGCGDDGGSTSDGGTTTTTTVPATTTTVDPLEQIMLDDPETGRTVTFAEFIDLRQLTEVATSYGPVWLEATSYDGPEPDLFADGTIAYMVDNCADVDAETLQRRENIEVVLVVCYGEGGNFWPPSASPIRSAAAWSCPGMW